jgi:hypothetical protein
MIVVAGRRSVPTRRRDDSAPPHHSAGELRQEQRIDVRLKRNRNAEHYERRAVLEERRDGGPSDREVADAEGA